MSPSVLVWACNTCGTVFPEHVTWCGHCKADPPKRGGQKRILVPKEPRPAEPTQRVNAKRTPVERRLRGDR